MRFATLIAGAALLVAASGCQSPPIAQSNPEMSVGGSEGETGGGYEGALGGVTYGHGESGIVDYRQVLSDPGPFE